MSKEFKEVIKAYLDKRAQEDELFAKAYAKEGKSLDECCKYIMSEARKYAEGNAVCVPDAEVYGWAVHYYDEEGIKVDDAPECEVQPVVAQAAKITAEATSRMEKEKAEKKVKKAKAEPVSPFVQLSLFG